MHRLLCLLFLFLSGCTTLFNAPNSYKYLIFKVPGGTHQLAPILDSEEGEGAFEMIQVNKKLEAVGDTMRVWMEHFSPGAYLNEGEAQVADLLIMCYPDHLPEWAVGKHVFPWHEGEIHLYTVSDNVIVVADKRIDTFDLVLHANAQELEEIAGR
ncbi:MAG: hypothetical protein KTR29_16260 [Rhodothermaceae bacterium]|nr:hypothetical protein [Rhodothermaceae bacterium]